MKNPTALQYKIASLCNIDISKLTFRGAAAMLKIELAQDVLGIDCVEKEKTTLAQQDIAQELKIIDLSDYRKIARLQIEAAFVILNEQSFLKYKFAPGMKVKYVGWPHKDHPDEELEQLTISTVKDDGRVYFKMSSGIPAYVNQILPIF